jgi:hypothetical protein
MTSTPQHPLVSRRRLLTKGSIAGGVTLAAVACGITDPDPVTPENGQIEAAPVDRVPVDDPHAREWKYGYPMRIELDGQTMANPMRPLPAAPAITVQAIHDGTVVGFRVTWSDRRSDASTVPCDAFRDAVAVMLVPGSTGDELRAMGNAAVPATILQWKADWQRDVDDGVQGVNETFPNASVDFYPPLAGVPHDRPVSPATYVEADATAWLPGLNVGNPNSAVARRSPVEKLIAQGFGTLATCPTQNALGRGIHTDGQWTATLARPLRAVDPDELSLRVGQRCSCAFALWRGGSGDVGGKKSPSLTTHVLVLKERR